MGKGGSFGANLVICVENVFFPFLFDDLCAMVGYKLPDVDSVVMSSFMIRAELLSGSG